MMFTEDIAEDVETRFDSSNYEIDRPLPVRKKYEGDLINGRWIRWKNYEKFVGLRAKTYSYLKDNNDKDKKSKGRKSCVIKRKDKFNDHKKCLKASQFGNRINYLKKKEIDVDGLKEDKKESIKNRLILKTQQRFKSEKHNVFTEKINKMALSSNDDKIM